MLRKLGRTMTGHDFLHHFPLHKPPRPIAGRALFVREKLFNSVVIQRGCSHVMQFGKSTIYARDFRSIRSTRRANTRDACAPHLPNPRNPRFETSISLWAIRRVFGSADRSGADRTSGRAGAAQE